MMVAPKVKTPSSSSTLNCLQKSSQNYPRTKIANIQETDRTFFHFAKNVMLFIHFRRSQAGTFCEKGFFHASAQSWKVAQEKRAIQKFAETVISVDSLFLSTENMQNAGIWSWRIAIFYKILEFSDYLYMLFWKRMIWKWLSLQTLKISFTESSTKKRRQQKTPANKKSH